MTSSTFYQQPDLNDNYLPLLDEHPLLQFYFKESFALMDKSEQPIPLLKKLFDKYLSMPNMNRVGRVIKQHSLVEQMQLKLNTLPEPVNIKQAFQLLNESAETISPDDDLIKLLSAYCSIFPYINRELTNPHIVNALTIRDINNIYFHTILKKSFEEFDSCDALFAMEDTVELAFTIGQYERLLHKLISTIEADSKFAIYNMKILLKYATVEQVENIVLPEVMFLLYKEDKDVVGKVLFYAMTPVIEKVSVRIVEEKIVPRLLELFPQSKYQVSAPLLLCIKRMDQDALKCSVQPEIIQYCQDAVRKRVEKNNESLECKQSLNEISHPVMLGQCDEAMRKMIAVSALSRISPADMVQYVYYIRAFDDSRAVRKSLETCISSMTEQELKDHIVKKIDFNKIDNKDYFNTFNEILQQVFSKINDRNYINQFFPYIKDAFLKFLGDNYKNLMSIMIKNLNEDDLIYYSRSLMKSSLSDLGQSARFMMLVYKLNQEFYRDLHKFCTGEQYNRGFVREIKRARVEERGCSMM